MRRWITSCLLMLVTSAASVAFAIDDPPNLVAGKKIEKDAKIQKGDKFVAVYEKKNYMVEVRNVKANGMLDIRWLSTGEDTEDVPQTDLYRQGDATPTRKSGKSPLPDSYQKLDKNKDGQIGLYEWDRAKYAEFRKLDKNHDGFLTPQELNGKSSGAAGTAAANKPSDATQLTAAEPDPGNLLSYGDKAGKSFVFSVTGKSEGAVWGSGPYSVDSDLAAVAVHAGLVKNGASGTVKVTIIESAESFSASEKNGITSVERQESGPAFSIEEAKK